MTFCTLWHAPTGKLYDVGRVPPGREQKLSAVVAFRETVPLLFRWRRVGDRRDKKTSVLKKVLRRRLILIVRVRPSRRKIYNMSDRAFPVSDHWSEVCGYISGSTWKGLRLTGRRLWPLRSDRILIKRCWTSIETKISICFIEVEYELRSYLR